MGKDPAFLFYPGDYLRDTQMLSEPAQVAYDRIICEHMRNICITPQQHKFLTKRLNEDDLEALNMVLEKVDGGYQIPWVVESINKRKAYSESRRKNREGKISERMFTHDQDVENENENENENINGNRVRIEGKGVGVNVRFEEFWTSDKKVKKVKAEKKWPRLTNQERVAIMDHIPRYKEAQPDKQFRQDPITYLNNRTWEDEIVRSSKKIEQPDTSEF